MRTWAIYERGRLITAFILLLLCVSALLLAKLDDGLPKLQADAAVPITVLHFYNRGVSGKRKVPGDVTVSLTSHQAIANPSRDYKGCFITYANRLIFVDIVLVVLTEFSGSPIAISINIDLFLHYLEAMLSLLILKARQHCKLVDFPVYLSPQVDLLYS